jgi:hypothetical protein
MATTSLIGVMRKRLTPQASPNAVVPVNHRWGIRQILMPQKYGKPGFPVKAGN